LIVKKALVRMDQ